MKLMHIVGDDTGDPDAPLISVGFEEGMELHFTPTEFKDFAEAIHDFHTYS